MKFKHTPGLWGIWHNEGGEENQPAFPSVVTDGTHVIIADCFGTLEIAKANARLISYAPEMLEDRVADIKELGPWLSAALDDPNACEEFKTVIRNWFERNKTVERATGKSIEEVME